MKCKNYKYNNLYSFNQKEDLFNDVLDYENEMYFLDEKYLSYTECDESKFIYPKTEKETIIIDKICGSGYFTMKYANFQNKKNDVILSDGYIQIKRDPYSKYAMKYGSKEIFQYQFHPELKRILSELDYKNKEIILICTFPDEIHNKISADYINYFERIFHDQEFYLLTSFHHKNIDLDKNTRTYLDLSYKCIDFNDKFKLYQHIVLEY